MRCKSLSWSRSSAAMICYDLFPAHAKSVKWNGMRFAALALALTPALHAGIEFNRDVRPILADKCYSCHGADAVPKKIPLRLDSEAAAKADLGGRRAVGEGDPATSQMIRRITAENKAQRMPPVYSGLKLSDTEIATLREWIAEGAKWEKHWSFIRPKRPALPAVKNAGWIRNPIDAFVLQRLEREGLAPSAEAGRETLLRRVSLDLTGLPPSVVEMDAFLNDKSANAYERAVDRLLASQRYGERMAERWLDAARYADTNGYQYDGERYMWRWRDWVIQSFNRNQPFDQFTLEQIAGDMLPGATLDQKIATGFNRNHRANTEDGLIPEEYAVEYVVDRIETTSTVFLGLTLGCARCHNHKYDPFTQKEFYQVFSYFNNIPELGRAMKYGNSPPLVPAPTREQQAALRDVDGKMRAIEDFLRAQDSAKWKGEIEHAYWTPSTGLVAAFPLDSATGGKIAGGTVSFEPGRIGNAAVFDGKSYLDAGPAANFDIEDRFSLSAWVYSDSTPQGAVVTRMVDATKGKGYGVYLNNGKEHVHITSVWETDAIRVETEDTLGAKRWHQLIVTYDGSRMAEGIAVYIDGKPAKHRVEANTLYRPFNNAGKAFSAPLRIGGGGGPERRFRGRIDDVRVYSRVLDSEEIAALALGESIHNIAAK